MPDSPAAADTRPARRPGTFTERDRFLDTALLVPAGLPRKCFRWIRPVFESLFGFNDLWRMHAALADPNAAPTGSAARALRYLGVGWTFPDADHARLAAVNGPLVVAANHPLGGLEFFALAQVLERARPGGWKFLANEILAALPGFGDCLIPVDPLGWSGGAQARNRRGMAEALRHLRAGGCLALFPAGRVAHRHRSLGGAVADRPWSPHAVRLAARTGASLATVHAGGRNGPLFMRVPHRWARLRALLLCREFTHPAVSTIPLRIAEIRRPENPRDIATTTARLHARCHLQADLAAPRRAAAPAAASVSPPPPADPAEAEAAARELDAAARQEGSRAAVHGVFDVLYLRGTDAPAALRALGRARERTFRAAGQGTGREIDLSPEDRHYHHLLLRDREAGVLAGAYRVGPVSEILAEQGPDGLYLNHVFNIRPQLFNGMGETLELSRSFVLPEYQRDSTALAALWKGLGAVAVRTGARTFFGSVTISSAHHPVSRAILVEYLRQNHADDPRIRRLVRPRKPFQPVGRYHRLAADAYRGEPVAALAPLIEDIEGGARGIPPLIRYYCSLGAKFLAFHVEPAFQDALYCLLRVDIPSVPAAYKKRFMPERITASSGIPASGR